MVEACGSIAGKFIDLLPESPLMNRFFARGGRNSRILTMLSDQDVRSTPNNGH